VELVPMNEKAHLILFALLLTVAVGALILAVL
jgi:hypothetical protein